MTEFMREKLLQLCTEAESILTPKNDSRIMFLGTPQTTFTVYRKLAERAYKPFVWPARYPKKVSQYEGLLAPQLVEDIEGGAEKWEVTDDRFDNEDLIEREASMGRSNFMLQFMLDTSLSDAEKFPLKCADLIVTSVNPTTAPESIVWCSDPQKVIKDLPTVGLPGDYFYSPMQLQGTWDPYQETIFHNPLHIRVQEDRSSIVLHLESSCRFCIFLLKDSVCWKLACRLTITLTACYLNGLLISQDHLPVQ